MSYFKHIPSVPGLFFLSVFLIFFSCSQNIKTERDTTLEEYLARAENLGFSGIVHFQKNDTVLLTGAKGFSHREKEVKNKVETPFYIASISKSFTAAAIVKLEDDEKLDINDSISNFFKNCPEDKANITIHQLLTHTSGVGSFGWDSATEYWRPMPKNEAVQGILNSPLTALPGESFHYNNANYVLLSAIIESASGKTYQDYIQGVFLAPLSLNNTCFRHTLDGEVPGLANSYMGGRDYGKYSDYPKSWLNIGGGDMITTASNMSKWMTGLYEKDILSKEGKNKMFSIQKAIDPNFGYGYGWYIRTFPKTDKKIIFHTGGFKGYASEARYYPHSKIATVVFVNDDAIPNSTEVISNDLLGTVNGKAIAIPEVQGFPENAQGYTGTYEIDSSSSILVKTTKEGLTAEYYGQTAVNFVKGYNGTHQNEINLLNDKTTNFISDLLNRPDEAFAKVLPQEDMQYLEEYLDEWKTFGDGRNPSSIALNHTTYLGNDVYRTFMTLTYPVGNKYFALTWQNGALIGTAVNRKFGTPTSHLFYSSPGELTTYDWDQHTTLTWAFSEETNPQKRILTIGTEEAELVNAVKIGNGS